MNQNSVSMDALVQYKNSLKADFVDIRNSINAFEDDLQRQNNTTQSLSELIKKNLNLKKRIKRLLNFKRNLNAWPHHLLLHPVLHLPKMISI